MLVETTGLRKVYGPGGRDPGRGIVAVDHLDLTVGRGEVFGFLGPNGAGKTTTVKMLLGLVWPTDGKARVLGCAPGEPAAMRRIGFLPEHFRFPPWLTAADFLDLHGRLYGMPAAQRRARIPRQLERVGLGDRAGSRLGGFSKGMQQRVGIAQALLNDPELVFLDEPTSGLDPLGRLEVRDLIRELRERGVTVFLNSHFLSEVEAVCDRVAIVKRGRIVRAGRLDELGGSMQRLHITATGMTPELMAGLTRWGQLSMTDRPRTAETPGSAPAGATLRPEQDAAVLTLAVASEDLAPDIADYLVRGGARLHALAPHRPSLEEVFVRVMAEAPE